MELYTGEIDWIDAVDVDAPIRSFTSPVLWKYAEAYGIAAKVSMDTGKVEEEGVFRLLQQLCAIGVSLDKTDQPYSPHYQGFDGRSCVPGDFTPKELDALDKLIARSQEPALRARLLDYKFIVRKDFRAGQEAALLLVEHAKKLLADDRAFELTNLLRRALQIVRLSKVLNKPIGIDVQKAVADMAVKLGVEPFDLRFLRLLKLMDDFEIDGLAELIPNAQAAANFHRQHSQEDSFRNYWDFIARYRVRSGDVEQEKAAKREVGESYLRSAEERVAGKNPSYMIASDWLKRGIEALRQGGEKAGRISELNIRLRDYQERIGSEMGVVQSSFDITDFVRGAREHVKGLSLMEALTRLALSQPETDVVELRQQVLDAAKENTLLAILDISVHDSKGRKTSIQRGLLDLKGDEFEQALKDRMIAHAKQFNWDFRATAYINPARLQILNEHLPTLEDMLPLVQYNPFVPPGREAIILRGLHAGLHGDLLVASHLLAPQLDSSIRHMLTLAGVHVANLNPDQTEPWKLAGGILGLPETKDIFGDGHLFEIRGVFYDEHGYNFRHSIAHGLASEAACYSPAGLNAWWLMLRFCLFQVRHRIVPPSATSTAE